MEHNEILCSTKQDSSEVIPSLIKFIASNEVVGFDSMEDICGLNNQCQRNALQPASSPSKVSKALFIFGKPIKKNERIYRKCSKGQGHFIVYITYTKDTN